MPHLILPFTWTLFFTFWGYKALNVKSTERHEAVLSRAVHIAAWAAAAGLAFTPWLRFGWLGMRWLPHGALLFPLGMAITWLGLGIAIWARRYLGSNWSASVTLKKGHELVRSGPYALVRHPIYTGALLAMLGTAVADAELRGLVALFLLGISFWRKIRIEERWLTEHFGDGYHRYQREIKALVPFVA